MSDDWPVEHRLRKAKERRHVLSAIAAGAEDWQQVLTTIASSTDADSARQRLREQFNLDDGQAIALLDIQFRRVSLLDRERLSREVRDLDAEIARYESEL